MPRTLLKLLARFLLPTEGIIWYPDNLRVRYLNDQPTLFSTDLMANLRFGNQKEHTDEEIWALCKLLKLGDGLIGNGAMPVGNRGLKLSVSDRIIVGVARALLSSVDLLLVSNSFDMLGIADSQYMLGVLKHWIAERGMSKLSADNPPGVVLSLKKKKTGASPLHAVCTPHRCVPPPCCMYSTSLYLFILQHQKTFTCL